MAKKFTLGREERLKSRKAIEALFNSGQRFIVSPFRVNYTMAENGVLQFGTGVSVKLFKKAVDRNLVKRLTREAYRLQKIPLQEKLESRQVGLRVFFTYNEREIPTYETVYESVHQILNKLIKIVNENSAPHT